MDQKFMKFEVAGLTWEQIVPVMDWSNVCSYIRPEVIEFIERQHLDGEQLLFVATHSFGFRDWILNPGAEPVFFEEPFMNGGWYSFREKDVCSVTCVSATSGSVLVANKWGPNRWVVTLELPLTQRGFPYIGAYAMRFESVLGVRLTQLPHKGNNESEFTPEEWEMERLFLIDEEVDRLVLAGRL